VLGVFGILTAKSTPSVPLDGLRRGMRISPTSVRAGLYRRIGNDHAGGGLGLSGSARIVCNLPRGWVGIRRSACSLGFWAGRPPYRTLPGAIDR